MCNYCGTPKLRLYWSTFGRENYACMYRRTIIAITSFICFTPDQTLILYIITVTVETTVHGDSRDSVDGSDVDWRRQ
jgi:hypothetical protein